MKQLYKVLVSVLSVFLFLGCGPKEQADGPAKEYAPYKVGEKVVIKSIHGKTKTLKRVEGGFVLEGDVNKVLIIDAFGTFCQPCQEEANHLMEFQLKNSDDLILIGLTHMEDVTDKHVLEQFVQKYNAFYFISNNKEQHNRLIAQMKKDIDYKPMIQLPFKFILKNGKYQKVTDFWDGNLEGFNFYIGKVDIAVMQKDLDRIKVTK